MNTAFHKILRQFSQNTNLKDIRDRANDNMIWKGIRSCWEITRLQTLQKVPYKISLKKNKNLASVWIYQESSTKKLMMLTIWVHLGKKKKASSFKKTKKWHILTNNWQENSIQQIWVTSLVQDHLSEISIIFWWSK